MAAAGARTRRILVCAITAVVGTVLLALSLGTAPGDSRFYGLTLALAATWGLGAALSGPLPLWRSRAGDRPGQAARPALAGVLTGLSLTLVSTMGALVLAQVESLRSAIDDVIDIAQQGSYPVVVLLALLTGSVEELFFRGALYDALRDWHPAEVTVAAYALITVATGNLMLIVAAVLLGGVTARQRQVTGGVLAPILTHVIWSLGMVSVLPAVLEVTS
ncbi:CPBP family intramembrane glutamic endopeptidase [Luteipulveratus mongoliensis]|uniref:CAAX prenyl protease 2/Lysostaphin resistance protein A-like domain-containing protein n=1 Tax=Luteipulveratus mongoliensis TaxID=571913 RepID=A0A0K1JKL6_9MICO|nr:type II CAAX endopeptidase family protein [Luteipulveratus mongoliensis]AKU17252.1 hypothetical protein VV02_17670 [Luteipulveratus mongoliensis]